MKGGATGTVRIIAGDWRGTRIPVAAKAGLRPTPDRIRETVFNWLSGDLPGARCLDLFAGTGALGFEAVSRGAASCDLIEQDRDLVAALEALKERLAATSITIHQADAFTWLSGPPRHYDIVFVDPPFDATAVARVLDRLKGGWIVPESMIYIEAPRDGLPDALHWHALKRDATRQVSYALLQYRG